MSNDRIDFDTYLFLPELNRTHEPNELDKKIEKDKEKLAKKPPTPPEKPSKPAEEEEKPKVSVSSLFVTLPKVSSNDPSIKGPRNENRYKIISWTGQEFQRRTEIRRRIIR